MLCRFAFAPLTLLVAACDTQPEQAPSPEPKVSGEGAASDMPPKPVPVRAPDSSPPPLSGILTNRQVRCHISNNQGLKVDRPCTFKPAGNGSFSLSLESGGEITPGVVMINLYVTSEGKAEVRGLTTQGINSRWGEVTRSMQDPACWNGSDFQLCAW